jgi:hypothetical protein
VHGSHVPDAQKPLMQSWFMSQLSPLGQPGHDGPPQSTSVSMPSSVPLAHAAPAPVLELPPAEELPPLPVAAPPAPPVA